MVRPVAKHGMFRRLVADNNRGIVAPARKHNLAKVFQYEIGQIATHPYRSEGIIRILDVGCGDMGIAEALMQQMPGAEMTCVDTYAPPADDMSSPKWSKYRQFDGKRLPFDDAEFDISICVDVLHHAGSDGAELLLREMLRTSRYIVVKDHFETGWFSRILLQLADFYGNWGYGVNIPRQYFREETWKRMIQQAGLKELRRTNSVQIHGKLFSMILPPRFHFISVMTNSENGNEYA
jgi:ubiquinone/menaquinone biosynthesis C-methylase UbiE